MRIFLIIILFACMRCFAQTVNEPCGFSLFTDTKSKAVEDFENKLAQAFTQKHFDQNSIHTSGIYTIPVVVHIIHNGGKENITDLQVLSQIKILNEDFRKVPGTKGDGPGVDTKIQFCLAKISPYGKCTNGIVRVKSTLTEHQTYQRGFLKDLSFWPSDKYLNIYVVNTINNGILGYASFPGGPPEADGVVIRDDAFGNIGTIAPGSNLGRTLTHEIAHWFGLYHTFQDGCGIDTCTDGDKICDTPPAKNPNYGCPAINSCSNDVPDVNDQVANYTDYSNDACKNMFTAGQRDRMQATLKVVRTNIWSHQNLVATGCDSAYLQPLICQVVADFTVSKNNLCTGSSIGFTNRSLNNPTGFLWIFDGGLPGSSNIENPIVTYAKPGVYSVRLKVWDTITQDSLIKINFINVTTPTAGNTLGINEGFENSIFPWSGIIIENLDTGVSWQRTTLASYRGKASVRINNLINTNYGQSDALVLPPYNFTTFSEIPYLRFNWAYARSSSNYSDELIVLISKDCGLNWQPIFSRTGNNLATGATQITEYIPDSNTIWKAANINLSAYASQANVLIKIVNVTDGGNCLYIDNINMGDTTLIWVGNNNSSSENEIIIYPNPADNQFTIRSYENLMGFELCIFDAQGRLCHQEVLQSVKENQVRFNQNLSDGIYFIVLKKGDKRVQLKIVKQ